MARDINQIVITTLACTCEAIPGTWTTSRGDGLNPVAALREVPVVTACMWKRRGTVNDVEAAKRYAEREGGNAMAVHVVPTSERNPLAIAKSLRMALL